MDFFNQGASHTALSSTVEATEFAEALQKRDTFAVSAPSPRMIQALARSVPTALGGLPIPIPGLPSTAMHPQPTSAPPPYRPFVAKDLTAVLDLPSTLVLDIRPHGQWKKSRIRNAVNLAVPSTLLRRPNFSLDQLCTMLPNSSDRQAFKNWPLAKLIVVYDADTVVLSQTSNIVSLLNKLKAARASAELGYLTGGINAMCLSDVSGLIDDSLPDENAAGDDPADGPGSRFLAVQELPAGAFQQGSTTGATQRPAVVVDASGAPGPSTTRLTAANPFYDNIRQHLELAGGITERIPLYIPRKLLKRRNELPFEWLRNIALWAGAASPEKGEEQESSSRSRNSSDGTRTTARSSAKRMAKANAEEGMEALAMQFYRIELGEQRRLQGVMDYHSRESGAASVNSAHKGPATRGKDEEVGGHTLGPSFKGLDPGFLSKPPLLVVSAKIFGSSTTTISRRKTGPNTILGREADADAADGVPEYFPFSITAGIEKGSKNRYRNIWPFDHARVRLRTEMTDDGSDYINASYIQPRSTNRQYIATQGPLPSTYNDFWTLVWEQNVRVLVMLTKRIEGHSVKCGLYWKDGSYGRLHLKLVKEEGGTSGERAEENNEGEVPAGGFDFAVAPAVTAKKARRAKADMERQVGKHHNPGNGGRGDTREPNNSSNSWNEIDTSSSSEEEDDSIIRREFLIWHGDDVKNARTIVQFQYVGWPDLSAPTSPKYLLKLINEINALYDEYAASGVVGHDERDSTADRSSSNSRLKSHLVSRATRTSALAPGTRLPIWENTQILVHCSAGVGRTGSFVLIDAILDAIRRETTKFAERNRGNADGLGEDHPTYPDVSGEGAMEQDPDRVASAGAGRSSTDGSSMPPPRSAGPQPLPVALSVGPRSLSHAPSLPAMESLSMRAMFSTSPPNPSSTTGTSRVGPSMLQRNTSTPIMAVTPPNQGQPSGSTFGSESFGIPTLLKRRMVAAVGTSSADATTTLNNSMSPSLTMFGSMAGASRYTSSQPDLAMPAAFEFMAPRHINVPRHSRKHHPKSQMAKLAAIKEGSRLKHALQPMGPQLELAPGFDDEASPPEDDLTPLSSLDEPVRQVLEAMREQRMSMCQSLRQYVFVHRAIIEGAMQIVDEVQAELDARDAGAAPPTNPAVPPTPMELSSPPKEIQSPYDMDLSQPPSAAATSRNHSHHFSTLALPSGEVLRPSPSGLGKRLASPTELIRTDISGAHPISKRPSLKRINKSSESSENFR